MEPRTEAAPRSSLAVLAAALVALGLVRVAARLMGLAVLLGVVTACVAAFAIGIPILRLLLLH